MERILTRELIDDLKSNEDFKYLCDSENEKWAMDFCLSDKIGLDFDFPNGEIYELVDAYREKGDGRDEETLYGIFLRKTDNKYFSFWVHDAGFIGPITYTICDYLEEVESIEVKKTKWEKL
jgi:hypothetical protein